MNQPPAQPGDTEDAVMKKFFNMESPVLVGILVTIGMAAIMVSGQAQINRTMRAAQPAPQTPPPPPTEQQAAEALIKSAIAWTERIGPVGRDWNQSQRRADLGAILCIVAERLNGDAMFHPQRDFACEALERYFPEIECWACEN